MPMTVTFDDKDLPSVRSTLDRAMNTWEPKDHPEWLQALSDRVDLRMGLAPSQPYDAREQVKLKEEVK